MEPHEIYSHEHLSDDEIVDHVEGRIPLTREQRRFRRWIYGLAGAGSIAIASAAAVTGAIIFVETERAKQAAPEKVEKKFPYGIKFEGVSEEECVRRGFKFTNKGLVLPTGELLGPAENIESITMRRNGENNEISYYMMMRRHID